MDRAGAKTLDIQGFSYEERQDLLPALAKALAGCGGWVLDRRVLSGAALELRIELELSAVEELYAALVEAGLELTRTGHAALTELCLCQKHLARFAGVEQTVTIRLEVSFLAEMEQSALVYAAMA